MLKQVRKQTGKNDERLEISTKRPQALFYLWEIFIQIFRFQEPMTYSEIWHWSQLTNCPLDSQEVCILKKLETLAYND